jgi:hypothetical protein
LRRACRPCTYVKRQCYSNDPPEEDTNTANFIYKFKNPFPYTLKAALVHIHHMREATQAVRTSWRRYAMQSYTVVNAEAAIARALFMEVGALLKTQVAQSLSSMSVQETHVQPECAPAKDKYQFQNQYTMKAALAHVRHTRQATQAVCTSWRREHASGLASCAHQLTREPMPVTAF